MSTIIHVIEHPDPATLSSKTFYDTASEPSLPPGARRRTPAEQTVWEAAEIAGGWTPQTPAVAPALRQDTRVVIKRMTPQEWAQLSAARQEYSEIERFASMALADGSIAEDDPDFPAARDALAQLGILSADRWTVGPTALLAP